MGDVGRVVAVTGTRREAAVLGSSGVDCLAIGGSIQALEGQLAGAIGIVSFGMAGALSPQLQIGDWVIGERVIGAFAGQCDARWSAGLARAMPQARSGAIYADGRLIGDPSEKSTLFRGNGALAADMESHLVAKAAARAGLPFAVLRCISDEATDALPPAIAVAMRPDGSLALGAILSSILRNPRQLPRIFETLGHFNRAYGSLRQSAATIPGRLAFDFR